MADISTGSSASVVAARPELSIHDGIVTTTSLQVAQFFGKRHDNVLRAIRALIRETAADDYRLNFEEVIVDFINGKGGAQNGTAYRMTREGFMLLAMGFTGKEALRWKLAYIAAFNRMEAELQKPAQDPQRIQVWLQTADETLDYRHAEKYYAACALRIQAGGDHSYQGFALQLPALLSFAGIAAQQFQTIDFAAL